jgi:hypothetical protein
MNNIIQVERTEDPTIVRFFLIDVDEDYGYKSVVDILEVERNNPRAAKTLIACWGTDWRFHGPQLAKVNLGRTHTQRGMLQKLIEQV